MLTGDVLFELVASKFVTVPSSCRTKPTIKKEPLLCHPVIAPWLLMLAGYVWIDPPGLNTVMTPEVAKTAGTSASKMRERSKQTAGRLRTRLFMSQHSFRGKELLEIAGEVSASKPREPESRRSGSWQARKPP